MFMLFYWRNFATLWYSETRILKRPKNIVRPLYFDAPYIYIYIYIYIYFNMLHFLILQCSHKQKQRVAFLSRRRKNNPHFIPKKCLFLDWMRTDPSNLKLLQFFFLFFFISFTTFFLESTKSLKYHLTVYSQ